MRLQPHHPNPPLSAAGFTLVELSVAISLMLMLSSILVVMLQQHLTFMEMAKRQTFLTNEAPSIGALLGRIINQADHYFVYANHDSARAGSQPIMSNGKAVRLFFRAADQTTRERLVAVETSGGITRLKFYTIQPSGSETSWVVSDKLADASFSADQGILNATLYGPYGEEITYSGGSR